MARELLREEAEADRSLYDDVQRKRIDYSRIRLVHLPLTAYLRYELMAYEIRSAMGENIEVVVPESGQDCFDFLLFDQECALVHDYGTGPVGLQSGGWLVRDHDFLAALEQTALALRRRARPIREFMATLDRLVGVGRTAASVAVVRRRWLRFLLIGTALGCGVAAISASVVVPLMLLLRLRRNLSAI